MTRGVVHERGAGRFHRSEQHIERRVARVEAPRHIGGQEAVALLDGFEGQLARAQARARRPARRTSTSACISNRSVSSFVRSQMGTAD